MSRADPRSSFGRAALVSAAVAAVGASAVFAGCSDVVPTVSATPSAAPTPVTTRNAPNSERTAQSDANRPLAETAFDDPARSSTVVYGEDFLSDPMPVIARTTKLSANEAISAAKSKAFVNEAAQPGQPVATLRMARIGFSNASWSPVSRPAWILTWRNSAVQIYGGALPDREAQREWIDKMRRSQDCIFVIAIDAENAESLAVRQVCRKR